MKYLSASQISRIGLFTAMTIIVSQISIPMPYGVPMTLQTFIIPLVAFIIGKKEGTLVAFIYLLLGAVGLPVFAGFTGSLSIILGPTGGFILSFPLMAYLSGKAGEKSKYYQIISLLLAAFVVNFLVGMIYFSWVTSSSLIFSFNACVLPFVPTSIIKIGLIVIIGKKLSSLVYKRVKPN